MHKQDPEHGVHRRLPLEVERHLKAAEFFKGTGDIAESEAFQARAKHTADRHAHALKAKPLIDALGLSHEVTPDTITYNDALNYVSKLLHEQQHGVSRSEYCRAHYAIKDANGGAHADDALLNAQRDHAAEVIEHLGLSLPEHVAAVNTFFGKAAE